MKVNIGNRIRALCKEQRIPLKELAKAVDISEAGLQGILKNNSTTVEKLAHIASYLQVPVGSFFEEDVVEETTKKEVHHFSHNKIGNNSTITVNALTECKHKLELIKMENEGLKKEIESQKKIIELQEALYKK